jgi:hypothetical protein
MPECAASTSLSIIPIPADKIITITPSTKSPNEILITIFTFSGQQVLQKKFQNQNSFEMDVNSLSPGIYLVQLQTTAGVETKKLVIQ